MQHVHEGAIGNTVSYNVTMATKKFPLFTKHQLRHVTSADAHCSWVALVAVACLGKRLSSCPAC